MSPKETLNIVTAAEEYAHIALEHGTPFIRHRNDFINGLLSKEAKRYWFEQFKVELNKIIINI